MKFKIGEIIEFNIPEESNCIPGDFSSNTGKFIGLRTSGIAILGDDYKKNKAKIIDVQDNWYIVEHQDANSHTLRLAYKEKDLRKIIDKRSKFADRKLRNILTTKQLIHNE